MYWKNYYQRRKKWIVIYEEKDGEIQCYDGETYDTTDADQRKEIRSLKIHHILVPKDEKRQKDYQNSKLVKH